MMYETERLILRQWQQSDLYPLTKMCADKEVMKFFPNVLSYEESVSFFERLQNKFLQDKFGVFAVELKSTKEFIGLIGLTIPPFISSVEIFWRVAREHQGKGYATEGALKCLEIGFNQFEFDEIVSFTAEINVKSQKVMQKIGMSHNINDDFMHPKIAASSKLAKHVMYKITKDEYKKTF